MSVIDLPPQATTESIKDGVSKAFWDWIHNVHDYTTTCAIQDGVRGAVGDWLDQHPDTIREAVKEAVIEWLNANGIGT